MRNYSLAALLLSLSLVLQPAHASEPSPPLSESTVFYMQVAHPDQLLPKLMNHALNERIKEVPAYESAMANPKFALFKGILAYFELQLERKWPEMLADASGKGLHIAFDAETQGLALVMQAQDEAKRDELLDFLVKVSREDAKKKKKPDPYPTKKYRKQLIYQVGEGELTAVNEWLVFANKKALSRNLIDEVLSGKAPAHSQLSLLKPDPQADAWMYLDLATLRKSGVNPAMFDGSTDNMLFELLFGQLLSTLEHTPVATGSLKLVQDGLHLSIKAPYKQKWVPDTRDWYAPGDRSVVTAIPAANDQVMSLRLNRDFSRFWKASPDLYGEKTMNKLTESETNLSTLFSGRDLANDLFAGIHPEVQLVAGKQDFTQPDMGNPGVKLPGFALVFTLKEPRAMQRYLKLSYQNIIGFLNIIGAQQDRPPYEMDFDMESGGKIYYAKAVMDLPASGGKEKEVMEGGTMHLNFSPTISFVGERFILSSTYELARALTRAATEAETSVEPLPVNQHFNVDMDLGMLHQVLSDNLEQLIVQNMLKKGQTRDVAGEDLGKLLMLLNMFDAGTIQLQSGPNSMDLNLQLHAEP